MNIDLTFATKCPPDQIKIFSEELHEVHEVVMEKAIEICDKQIGEANADWDTCAKVLGIIFDSYNDTIVNGYPVRVEGFVSAKKDIVVAQPTYEKIAKCKPEEFDADEFMQGFTLILEVKNDQPPVEVQE